MKRRQFISLIGGVAVAWPLAARAQQPAMPVVGFMSARSPGESAHLVAAFRRGLGEGGFIEGQNVALEFRWARGQYDRLPALATELVNRGIAVLVAVGGDPSSVAAKQATSTIPIVFGIGGDPVKGWLSRELQPARRECDRRYFNDSADGAEAVGPPARVSSGRSPDRGRSRRAQQSLKRNKLSCCRPYFGQMKRTGRMRCSEHRA